MSGFVGELIGTMILIILGGGVCAGVSLKKSAAENSGWIVITFGWGLAVAVGVYAVGKFTGAHLNPAVTLGLAISGDFPWSQVPEYILGQMIGAFLGACIVYLHYLPHWKATEDPAAKLGVFSTAPAIPHAFSNLLSEIIGTFVLVMGIQAIGANKFTEGLNPLIVGFLIVAIGLSLGGTTGYAINPARDLGPRIAHFVLPIAGKGTSNWRYAWIPVVGPILGGMFGALFYKAVFLGDVKPAFWVIAVILVVVVVSAYVGEKKLPGPASKVSQQQASK
ncbi:glycerol uptake facilitator protein [Pullulanibacillus camelliae]|uniref:Glycerol uptake facilitator protein n=1 Tax=Pullulanibacillus camelliae TaxID=1707096 RepID=A0A8J2YKN7_9BACL|nr:MIP/aquaporin family protein [Pullulanibacillus camelliae]GGE49740.1 glycerol uptake facilitator protein [Pullulanibacillus camelliae]